MTRFLVSTAFSGPGDYIATVVSERDVTDTLESAQHRLLVPGTFVHHRIVNYGGDLEGLVELVASGRPERRILDAAISYFYNAELLPNVVRGGLLANPAPAPLSVDEIRTVLVQLAQHPGYHGQIIRCYAEDATPVELRDGDLQPDQGSEGG